MWWEDVVRVVVGGTSKPASHLNHTSQGPTGEPARLNSGGFGEHCTPGMIGPTTFAPDSWDRVAGTSQLLVDYS